MSHALLSPSSASRWINCPPSALLNAEAGDRDTVFTREGTLAHAVAELKARKHFIEQGIMPGISNSGHDVSAEGGNHPGNSEGLDGVTPGPQKYGAALRKLKAAELWQEEMDGHTDAYLDALKDIAATFAEMPYVALEQRVDFSGYVPEGFGTADCIMIGGEVLHIVDFKYGKGVDVSAEDNPQLKLYAVGAIEQYMAFYDIFTVRMTIVQPRIKREPDTWELPARDLLRWAEDVVKPAAALAAAGEGEYVEGDWCRWCAVRANCRARASANTALEDFGEKLPPLLTDKEVGQALTLGRRLKSWLSELEEYALTACLNGSDIPGWKAVEGRAVRAWTDQDAAFKAAKLAGVPEEMLYKREPVSLAQLEKIMGKKAFAETFTQPKAMFVITPPGKPTLVGADDKQQAITNKPDVEDDFGEELPF